ncbi:hypothetical protein [Bacillus pumilus]|uniref:hypothetical protein n=1 Tax=Bacillus pumilus TaxID=1408 RepID=UPI0022828596|nr:hypothetical protein [Bacillus pumilus]MCY7500127.1 hypothetical protein [Bacillus pumilus]MCY7528549.1 hypothetical protein [Bacillus pumilus]MED4439492.1 hypothetical protein [Bacillus pumilus]MED4489935.1 hypothetical protein [Bacillus pumilus]
MRDSWEETVSRINDELEEMRALKTKEGRKAYAQACGIVSRKYKMPFELCLAVGAKNVEVLAITKDEGQQKHNTGHSIIVESTAERAQYLN